MCYRFRVPAHRLSILILLRLPFLPFPLLLISYPLYLPSFVYSSYLLIPLLLKNTRHPLCRKNRLSCRWFPLTTYLLSTPLLLLITPGRTILLLLLLLLLSLPSPLLVQRVNLSATLLLLYLILWFPEPLVHTVVLPLLVSGDKIAMVALFVTTVVCSPFPPYLYQMDQHAEITLVHRGLDACI